MHDDECMDGYFNTSFCGSLQHKLWNLLENPNSSFAAKVSINSWGKKDSTKRYLWSKTILITGSVGGPEVYPPPRKMNTFLLGLWLLVCQFIDISNQIEQTGEVANI